EFLAVLVGAREFTSKGFPKKRRVIGPFHDTLSGERSSNHGIAKSVGGYCVLKASCLPDVTGAVTHRCRNWIGRVVGGSVDLAHPPATPENLAYPGQLE